jgi:AcrR family transcriptional regulator
MSTRMSAEDPPRTQAERTALSDSRMLDAAVQLIVERGADGTTLKDVGELAGYSRGLAGYRFGTKANLFCFIVRSVGEDWLRELGQAVENRVGLDAIIAAADAHYHFVLESADRIRAFYILWFNSIGPDPELKQVIAHVHERRQKDVEQWIERGIEVGALRDDVNVRGIADQFCAAIIGIVYQWLVTPEAQDSIKQLHDGLKQQMIRALGHPGPVPIHTGGTAHE